MPATASRPVPVDLWLCGHHSRRHRQVLARAGAEIIELAAAGAGAAAWSDAHAAVDG